MEADSPANCISSTFENVTLCVDDLLLRELALRKSAICENREMINPGTETSFYSIAEGSELLKSNSWNSLMKKVLAASTMRSIDSLNLFWITI